MTENYSLRFKTVSIEIVTGDKKKIITWLEYKKKKKKVGTCQFNTVM